MIRPEATAEFYDNVYSADKGKYKGSYKKSPYYSLWLRIIEVLKKYNIEAVDELGCGTGQFAELLYKKMPKVMYYGIDYSLQAILIAHTRKLQGLLICKTIDEHRYLNRESDYAVVCLETLEHIEKDTEIIARIPAGAHIVLSVPSFDSASHVRVFKTMKVVLRRYAKYMDLMTVETFTFYNGNKIFMIHGRRNDYT
jgi:2-polyprenyl-3-methyl-5-hydroxy-6-metoxy-1,4-benzoquinol methylase